MNDWLDYRGSGSVRAYANELAHGFFDTKKQMEAKQSEAEFRLYLAKQEKLRKLQSIAQEAKQQYEEALKEYESWSDEYSVAKKLAKDYEIGREQIAKAFPLKATERYGSEIYNARKRVALAKEKMDSWKADKDELEAKWKKAKDNVTKFQNQLNKERILEKS